MAVHALLALMLAFPAPQSDKEAERKAQKEAQKQADKAAADAIKQFQADYKNKDPNARAGAVSQLSGTRHSKVLSKLAALVRADVPEVRIAAAQGLGEFKEMSRKAVSALMGGLGANAKLPEVLVAIYDALGKLGDPSALGAVHVGFKQKDTKAAVAAIKAAATLRNRASIDQLIAGLKSAEARAGIGADNSNTTGNVGGGGIRIPGGGGTGKDVQKERAKELAGEFQKALESITGESHNNSREWQTWWRKNMRTFKIE